MKLKTALLAAFMLLLTSGLFAQSAAEIEAAKAMARSYGYSDSEINAMINNAGGGAKESSSAAVVPEVSRTVTENAVASGVDATPVAAVEANVVVENIFGHGIFKSPNLNFVPSYNIPTPKNYVLGAGDELVIDIWGAVQSALVQKISPEGSITIPNVGPVFLVGNTIEQATKVIKGKLSQIYSGLSGENPNTFMRVTLGSIRSITVNVIGDVERPGTYTIPSLSTVFSAVYMAGGPTERGSVRNISLYRNNKLIKTLDVYDFVQNGDFSSNVRLEENDLIKVNIYDNIITIDGAVKRPMRYELTATENLCDLLELAGGYSASANTNIAHVVRRKGEQAQSFDVSSREFASFVLVNGDVVSIPSNIKDNKNSISISGAVWHPGTYSISDTLTNLRELILVAGGLRDDAYVDRGYIERYDEYRNDIALNFSVEDVMDGSVVIYLNRDDRVRIFAVPELERNTTVTVSGYVNNAHTFQYRTGMTLGDAILLCGGYAVGASKANIDVARRNANDSSMVATNNVATIFNFNLLEDPSAIDFELAPYDIVFVRNAPDYKTQQTITIEGEVNFPGTYVIPSNTVRISEIIAKAGGLTVDAYLEGATVTRLMTDDEYKRAQAAAMYAARQERQGDENIESVLGEVANTYNIGINMVKALDEPASYNDLVLKTGDVINIPRVNNTVTIRGAVQFPNTVVFDGKMTVRDYIAQAGGYSKKAKRSDIYIVYMNGTVATKKHGNFKPAPGCEIVVPLKDMSGRREVSTAEIMSIATSATSIATMAVSMVSIFSK